jgi:hypothetical protein
MTSSCIAFEKLTVLVGACRSTRVFLEDGENTTAVDFFEVMWKQKMRLIDLQAI